jgi:hypothetical protein
MENNFFFMVFVEGQHTPAFKHPTLEAAEKEAKRLAEFLNKKAWVLTTIKSVSILKWHVEDCRPSIDDLPF